MTQGVSMGLWYMYHFQGKVHMGNVTSSAFNAIVLKYLRGKGNLPRHLNNL